MKRSEMVEKLAEFIALFEDQHPDACLNLADQYLRVIEKAGMVPPTIEFYFGGSKVRDNAWESEDG